MGRRLFASLTVATLLAAATSASAYTLIFKDGRRLELKAAPRWEGKSVTTVRTRDGRPTRVAKAQVDLQSTRELNALAGRDSPQKAKRVYTSSDLAKYGSARRVTVVGGDSGSTGSEASSEEDASGLTGSDDRPAPRPSTDPEEIEQDLAMLQNYRAAIVMVNEQLVDLAEEEAALQSFLAEDLADKDRAVKMRTKTQLRSVQKKLDNARQGRAAIEQRVRVLEAKVDAARSAAVPLPAGEG